MTFATPLAVRLNIVGDGAIPRFREFCACAIISNTRRVVLTQRRSFFLGLLTQTIQVKRAIQIHGRTLLYLQRRIMLSDAVLRIVLLVPNLT